MVASVELVGNVLLPESAKTPLTTPLLFRSACSGGLSTLVMTRFVPRGGVV